MYIKERSSYSWWEKVLSQIPKRGKWLIGAGVLGVIGLGMFGAGYLTHKSGKLSDYSVVYKNPKAFVGNFIAGKMASPKRLTIDIKHKHLQKLYYINQMAINNGGILVTNDSDEDFVPIDITYDGKKVSAKTRIKGNWKDSRSFDKLSLRVKVKGENTLMGMKKFSLHDPIVKGFLVEWIFHEMMGFEDFVRMRYDFVEVVINGKNRGIFAIEEHFDKRLIEHNRNREGIIMRFDEYHSYYRFLASDRAQRDYDGTWIPVLFGVSPVDAFGTSAILLDEGLKGQFLTAKNLLEAYRSKKLPASQVFEIERMAKLFALSDLLGSTHSVMLRNIKFYYNPVTSRLQPIGYDQHGYMFNLEHLIGEGKKMNPNHKDGESPLWEDSFFEDPTFYAAYLKALEEVSDPSYLERFIDTIQDTYKEKLGILYTDYPELEETSFQTLAENQHLIQRMLHPMRCIEAYQREITTGKVTLELGNFHLLPAEITGLTHKGQIIGRVTGSGVIEAKTMTEAMQYQPISFSIDPSIIPDSINIDSLLVTYKVWETNNNYTTAVRPWTYFDQRAYGDDFMRANGNIETFDFIQMDTSAKQIHVKPGSWTLDRKMIVPKGFTFTFTQGTTIDLINNAKILSYSPLVMMGTELQPIRIHSSDSTGQGLLVIKARRPSQLAYVTFDQLTHPVEPGWSLSGAVNFYESPVDISYCTFSRNRLGDDCLNVIRTTFTIDNSLFFQTASDALDADFCEGTISNTRFIESGNDAIDISGSQLTLSDLLIHHVGDKGLSAGEHSQMTGTNISIKHAELAVTSKDLSEISLTSIQIDSCKVGYTAFQKKAEFGTGIISVSNGEINDTERPFLIEEGSQLWYNESEIAPERANVKDILYGVEYGKSSK